MNEIEILKKKIEELERWKSSMESSSKIPLMVDFALQGRGFVKGSPGVAVFPVPIGGTGASSLTGILKGNGASPFTAIVPLAGTGSYYVSDGSGGAVTRKLTFSNGVLISET